MTKVRLEHFFGLALAACVSTSSAAQVHPAFGSLSWRQGDPALAALPVRTSEGAELRLTNSAVSVFLHESRRGFVGRAAWLRVRDAGGEIFQYRPIASADAGENYILSYSVANGKHDGKSWGGRNDGKLDLPFVLDSIVMGFTPPGGTVRLVSVETDEPGSPTTPVAACRFEIDTGTAYHVVTSADSPVAAVFINPSGRPARLVGTLRGLDAFERSFRQPLDVCVGAGRSVRVPLQGPLPAKGHWNVCAELDDGARKVYKSARFAWLDAHPKRTAKPVGRFRLGINFHGLWMTRDDLEIGLDALDACGCELVRVAFSGQCAVQKKGPEDWNWNEDWYLEKLKARHFAIDNLCHHLPGWIRDRSRPQMANDLVALEEFYARMAARYGTDIDYYEIGNEWDFWKPEVFEPAAALETYLASARGVKRGCPSAKVVPNGWATWDSAHPAVRVKDFPESFMRQAHGHYDAFPIHEHGEFTHYRKAILERFLPRRKSMALDDVPWYAGETGLSSVNGNEIVVAENVWKKVLFSIASGAADYVWYNLRATGWEENDPEAGFGLMTRDFQPRAGYAAFSSLATLLEDATFERILVSEKTREAYLFRKGDGKFVVGWDSQCFEPVEISIRTDVAQAMAIDLMGNRCPLVAESGTFTWKLGQRPSAMLFPGAKDVEPDRERICAVADPERRIPVRAKAGFDREPDVVCEELRFVHNSYEANPATVDRAWKGVKDHSFRAWFDLGEDRLRILVRVADDIHEQTASEPRLMSQGDCVRVDLRVPGLIGLWRLGFRRTNEGKSDSCVWVAPAGTDLEKASAALRLKTRRTGGMTDYAVTIPFAEFSLSEKAFADGVGVWIMSDDNDGPGTDGWTGLSDGIVLTCDPNADKSDLYVMLPAAVYDGNRAFTAVATGGKWPPHYAGEEEIAVRPRRLAANCLQALKPDGSGVIRLKTSDLSVPCAGVWNRVTGRARIVFAPQKVGDEEVELSVSGDRIALSPPEAEKAATVFDFKAESLADFYETFARNRKCLWPGAALKADDVAGKVRAVVDHCNRNRWKDGAYRTVEGYFAPGWISGAPLAHALLGSSDPLTHQRAVDTLDYLVGHQAATGFFPRLDAEGRPKDHRWIDPTLPTDHALRYSVDAFYWLVRALEKEGTHETWKAGVRKAADAFVRLWKEYGEFGQHANLETGRLRVGGSAVGALVPPALLKASVLLEKSDYAAVAEAAAERYARTFIEKGVSYGGPPDALMAPDSESAYMLVVMAVAMAERTQSDLWKKRAMSAADQFSTWVVPYRFAFPEGCEMARHHVDTTGSVWANVQNRHSAPGICTMSGESLLALSKLTGERRFAELYADIKAFLPQVVSTESDPITARLYTAKPRQLPAGFMNERVNMSTWEKPAGVGEVFCGSCWPEACLLLMYPEYVRTGRLCPEAPGAVFIEGETVSFRADGVPAGKSCRVLDWLGAAVAEGSVGADGCVRMTGIPVGYYRLSLEGCRDATFAVVPDPAKRVRDVRSFVGVDSALSWCWQPGSIDCPWYDGDTFRLGRELLIRSGVPHVRERLNWGEVQGRPDMSPQWGRYLVNARELSKSGVFVTDMFHDAPAWTGFVGRHLPSDLKALHGFCAAFARDFSGFVTDCEFWNEQDISNLSDEGAWDFAACMKAAFLGFRQGNPQLVVAPGAVCRDGRNAYDDVLYRNGMGKYCDVFNFHTYNSVASLPSLAADARNQLSRAGITGRALWMTECGTNREGPALGESGRKGVRAASPLQELLWAESIPKTQLVNLFNGVSRSYTFVFAAHNEQGGIKDWGVVRRDGTVKPSFSALSTLAGEVGDGAELLGRLRLADGKAVGYLFRKGDSSQTLAYWSLSSMDENGGIITELPLGERRFSLAAADGEYRLTDMCGRVKRIRSSGGRLELTATRYPAYLSGLSGLKPEEAPVPPGSVGPVPAASDEDLSVIVRVDADKGDFRLGAGRSRLEMTGGQGKMRVSVWNLGDRAKRGTLAAIGGTLSGMPRDIAIPAGGVVRFDAVYTPDFKEGEYETELRLDGKFEGRRTTSCAVPMYSESRFLKAARSVTLDAMRPERWKRNTSAQKYSCVWDEEERALRFDVEWTEPVDRWFYPQYALAEGESLEGARQLVFEVRTEQDKVENDFVATLAFFRSATSEYERPFRTWERRCVELPRPTAEPLTGFSLGCNPKGRKLTFWLRNLQAVYGKRDKKGND